MTIIKVNAITVPAEGGDELARRFAARAGAVDDQPGFEGFELLKPTDERHTWLVITRWADDESFQAWVSSAAFGQGHRGGAEPTGKPAEPTGKPAAPKVAMSSELWSYEIAGGSSR
jgi:heme-degrading monooxygenase HmoA